MTALEFEFLEMSCSAVGSLLNPRHVNANRHVDQLAPPHVHDSKLQGRQIASILTMASFENLKRAVGRAIRANINAATTATPDRPQNAAIIARKLAWLLWGKKCP